MTALIEQIRELSKDQQMDLMESLWTEINSGNDELSAEEISELVRRAEEAEANPESGISWEEFRAKLLKEL